MEIKTNSKYVPFQDIRDKDLGNYLQLGTYATNIGDFVVAACCDIVQVPIAVICSNSEMNVKTFFPAMQSTDQPIYIAYNSYENHYHGTQPLDNKNDSNINLQGKLF